MMVVHQTPQTPISLPVQTAAVSPPLALTAPGEGALPTRGPCSPGRETREVLLDSRSPSGGWKAQLLRVGLRILLPVARCSLPRRGCTTGRCGHTWSHKTPGHLTTQKPTRWNVETARERPSRRSGAGVASGRRPGQIQQLNRLLAWVMPKDGEIQVPSAKLLLGP